MVNRPCCRELAVVDMSATIVLDPDCADAIRKYDRNDRTRMQPAQRRGYLLLV